MVVLDIYDDPTASIIARRLLETGIPLQEKLASSTLLEPADLAVIPDRLFALVGRTSEGELLRKYAMHDEAHVLSSIVYFMECGNALSAPVREKVAANLVNACAWYDVEPPAMLIHSALVKEAKGETVENPSSSWDPVAAAMKGSRAKGTPGFDVVVDTKVADLRGDAGAQGALSNDPRRPPGERKGLAPKVASAEAACHYALPDRQLYPLADAAQVKRASRYFEEHAHAFTAADRHAYAQNVAARASELGVKVASAVLENGGTEYGSYIREELWARTRAFDGCPEHATYSMLLEKQASLPPSVMLDMLQRVDTEAGVDRSYGRGGSGFRDPYAAVYGTKVAAVGPFEWIHEGHYTSEPELLALAKNVPTLDHVFGAGFTPRFAKDPVSAFKSLSTDQKVILCRLANEASRTP